MSDEPLDELAMFCEIDGHCWIEHHLIHGLVLGPKSHNMSRICQLCKKEDFKVFVPISEAPNWPKWMYTVWPY